MTENENTTRHLAPVTRVPDLEEIRLFTGAKLFHPYKIVACPPSNTIQWSKTTYPLKDLIKVTVLPAIVRVETGYLGQGNIDSISSGQVAVIQGMYKQKRVIAVPVRQIHSHYLSFPLTGYSHKFAVCKAGSNGSHGDVHFDEASTLDSIVRKAKLPVSVRFSDDRLHAEYGLLSLVHVYEEVYLYGHGATGDGSLYAEVMFMPLYLDVALSVAEGLQDGNTNDWNIFKNAYTSVSAAFLKGSLTLGYSDMAIFDGSWDESQCRARAWEPTRNNKKKPGANSKADADCGKLARDDCDNRDDDCDGDDYHSYVSPSDYIKFTQNPSVISNARAPAEYVKVEGLHGTIGRKIAGVLEILEKDSSLLSTGILPPPRPPKAKPALATDPTVTGKVTPAADRALMPAPRQHERSISADPRHPSLGRLPPPVRPLPATPKSRTDSALPDCSAVCGTDDDTYERVDLSEMSPCAVEAPAVAGATTGKVTYYNLPAGSASRSDGGTPSSELHVRSTLPKFEPQESHLNRLGNYYVSSASNPGEPHEKAETIGRIPRALLQQLEGGIAAASAFNWQHDKPLASVSPVWKPPVVSQGHAAANATYTSGFSNVSQISASVADDPIAVGHDYSKEPEECTINGPSDVPQDFSSLTHKELCQCFRVIGLHSCADAFQKDGVIDGCLLMAMDAEALREHFHFTQYDAIKVIKFAKEGWRPR